MTKKEKNIYNVLRILLYGGALTIAIFLTLAIVFPQSFFTFNFDNPRAAKNTLADPRNESGQSLEKGKIQDGEKMIFDASDVGFFSQAEITLKSKEAAESLVGNKISVKKSYQAFFYPEVGEMGFSDGSLLKIKNRNIFYFISLGEARKFKDFNVAYFMGFRKDDFWEIEESDLAYNKIGSQINRINDFPIGTAFKIEEDFYQLEKDGLRKFITPEAFYSYPGSRVAIEKGLDFLEKYSLQKEPIGFFSGSLLAYGTSAFTISDNLLLPIGDALIFESKGFKWEDLIDIGGDVLSFYEKGKIFELDSPHHSGTVFVTQENSQYYLILNKKKYLLPTEGIAKSWIKRDPVKVSAESLVKKSSCSLEKNGWFFKKNILNCDLTIENFNDLLGTDYEFELNLNKKAELSLAEVVLKKNKNKENFKFFLADLIGKIKRHYVR